MRQHRIEITNTDSLAIHLLQEPPYLLGLEGLLDGGLQPGKFLRLFNLDGSLFKRHCHSQTLKSLERETGIEPATNSLEGCDSTTELLPLNCRSLANCARDFGCGLPLRSRPQNASSYSRPETRRRPSAVSPKTRFPILWRRLP